MRNNVEKVIPFTDNALYPDNVWTWPCMSAPIPLGVDQVLYYGRAASDEKERPFGK